MGERIRRITVAWAAVAILAACDNPPTDPDGNGPGSLVIHTVTTGIVDTNGYEVLGIGASRPIAANDSILVSGLEGGTRQISLGGISKTCGSTSPSTVPLTIDSGVTVTASFELDCEAQVIYTTADGGPGVSVWNADFEGDSANFLFRDLNNELVSLRLSPEGTRLAYFLTPDFSDPATLVVRDLLTGDTTTLVEGVNAFIRKLAWSPMGDQIAYLGPLQDIWIVDVADGATRQVTADVSARNLDWSPDASRLAFQDGDTLALIDVDGSNLTSFSYPRESNSNTPTPQWLPDGRIGFSDRQGSDHVVLVANPDGSELVEVFRHPSMSVLSDWSPDGEWLLMGSVPGRVIKIRADGSDTTQVRLGATLQYKGSGSWNQAASGN